jgi:hypothetical protein
MSQKRMHSHNTGLCPLEQWLLKPLFDSSFLSFFLAKLLKFKVRGNDD